jgi:2'-5' RNA ligase
MPKPFRYRVQQSFSPALPRRSIVWFPDFADAALLTRIDRFRRAHDPLHLKVAPHVALVFPFNANLSVAQVASHIKRTIAGWPHIPVTFHGTSSVANKFVLLMCELRSDALTELHNQLYRGVLKQFLRDDISYSPHITLGAAESSTATDAILAEAELIFRDTTEATLRALSILTQHENGRITVDETVTIDLT